MPTHETQPADLTGRSAVMRVEEVVAIVRKWVDLHARHLPDFAGAYLWGGITALPPDAPFELYRDVDAEKPVFAAQLQAVLAALGYTSVEAWAGRVAAAERLTREIYSIADALVALHPE